MKRYETIKLKKDFDYIINKGKKLYNNFFSLYYVVNKDDAKSIPLFGIGVSKKLGNAVFRNKIKRQMRHIIDNNKNLFKNGFKYIILINKKGVSLSFLDKEKHFKQLMKEETK